MRKNIFILGLLLVGLAAACKDRNHHAGHSHGAHAGHHHDPPHGGTGVVLGNEDYHIEFLLEPESGSMKAWILSAHMENFVRIASPGFKVEATVNGKKEVLEFSPVASPATGEKVGNTSQFEAKADWLKTAKEFDANLKEITIRGREYRSVAFNFPKGN